MTAKAPFVIRVVKFMHLTNPPEKTKVLKTQIQLFQYKEPSDYKHVP